MANKSLGLLVACCLLLAGLWQRQNPIFNTPSLNSALILQDEFNGVFGVQNAHAHNDYLHPVPFYTAYDAGFGSIEVDIFLVNDVLYVAHKKEEIQAGRTLKSLYLDPLLKKMETDKGRRLRLLVDIKDDYQMSLPALIREIEPLTKYLTTPKKKRAITILISGNRPRPVDYKNYPDYILFDDDLKLPHSKEQWKRVGQVSLPFNKLSAWKGEGLLKISEKKQLKHVIDSVHSAGKKIRFWAAPDNVTSWKIQSNLGVDLIGTDKIEEFVRFLRN